ncbi:MAG TPA: tetratricopeptide repeat protein [Polyangiales bacterium]|nr:tetratricopeptide repeat protein [Polyangiales bacterium]
MRYLLGMLLLLQLLAASVPAQAQHLTSSTQWAPPDESARPTFEAGRRAYEAGRFAEALDSFQRVYVLTGHPAMLINIANAHARLGEPRRAAASLQEYLAQVPDAADRALLESRIAELEKQRDSLELPPAPSPPPMPMPPPPPPVAAPSSAPSGSSGLFLGRTFTWVALGSSLVFAGVATWVWIDANQEFERLALTCGATGSCTDEQLAPVRGGVTATNICVVGSLLSLATAGLLFYLEGKGNERETTRVTAGFDGHTASIGVRGSL